MYNLSNSSIYSKERRLLRLLLGTLIALVVSDGIISEFLITNGTAREGNPFLHMWVSDNMFLPIKLLGVFLASVSLWYVYRNNAKLSLICAVFFVVLYTVIVFWNLYITLCAPV